MLGSMQTLAKPVESLIKLKAIPISKPIPEIIQQSFLTAEPKSLLQISPTIFDTSQKIRKDILHRCVVYEQNSMRQGSANTKSRGEVRGSTRKLYQQKGSGNARVGSIRSPIRRGGGVVFGPKPRDFGTDLPRKIWLSGIRNALLSKYLQNQLIVVDAFGLPTHKTRYLEQIISNHPWSDDTSLLLRASPDDLTEDYVNDFKDENGNLSEEENQLRIQRLFQLKKQLKSWNSMELAARNMSYKVLFAEWTEIGVWDLLKWKNLIIEELALKRLQNAAENVD